MANKKKAAEPAPASELIIEPIGEETAPPATAKKAAVRKTTAKKPARKTPVQPPAPEPPTPVDVAPPEPANAAEPAPAEAAVADLSVAPEPLAEEPAAPAENQPAPRLERLQKILAQAGIASRRHAEELITEGRVQVNGQVVTQLGSKADPARDHIRVDGKLLHGAERHRYFVLNKPRGYVTTAADPEGRPTVMQFFAKLPERLYPVGRLDFQSEGLLLVTNDGELSNALTRAASGVEKTYLVKVAGQPEPDLLDRLREGVAIHRGRPGEGKVRTAPARIRQVRQGDNPWFEVVLIEGRNRELRKMFEEIGHHVEKIRRVGYGPLVLDVELGETRELEPEEIEALRLVAAGKLKLRRTRPLDLLPKEAGKAVDHEAAKTVGKRGWKPRPPAGPRTGKLAFDKPFGSRPGKPFFDRSAKPSGPRPFRSDDRRAEGSERPRHFERPAPGGAPRRPFRRDEESPREQGFRPRFERGGSRKPFRPAETQSDDRQSRASFDRSAPRPPFRRDFGEGEESAARPRFTKGPGGFKGKPRREGPPSRTGPRPERPATGFSRPKPAFGSGPQPFRSDDRQGSGPGKSFGPRPGKPFAGRSGKPSGPRPFRRDDRPASGPGKSFGPPKAGARPGGFKGKPRPASGKPFGKPGGKPGGKPFGKRPGGPRPGGKRRG